VLVGRRSFAGDRTNCENYSSCFANLRRLNCGWPRRQCSLFESSIHKNKNEPSGHGHERGQQVHGHGGRTTQAWARTRARLWTRTREYSTPSLSAAGTYTHCHHREHGLPPALLSPRARKRTKMTTLRPLFPPQARTWSRGHSAPPYPLSLSAGTPPRRLSPRGYGHRHRQDGHVHGPAAPSLVTGTDMAPDFGTGTDPRASSQHGHGQCCRYHPP